MDTLNSKIQVIQVNLGHTKAAWNQFMDVIERHGTHIAIVSEPYTRPCGQYHLIRDFDAVGSQRSVIYVRKNIKHEIVYKGRETVAISVGGVCIVGVYWSPSDKLDGLTWELQCAVNSKPDSPWIIAGDLNVGLEPVVDWSVLPWRKREKSYEAQLLFESLDFRVCNNKTPTCTHLGAETINDYTLARNTQVDSWHVDLSESMSDHRYIWFGIETEQVVQRIQEVQMETNEEEFNKRISVVPALQEAINAEALENNVIAVTEWLQSAVRRSTEKKCQRKGASWWHPALTELKKKVNILAARRRRWLPASKRQDLEKEFAEAKRNYRREMAKAREYEYRSFVTCHQPWGRPYKYIVKQRSVGGVPAGLKKLDGSVTATTDESISLLMQVKFPEAGSLESPPQPPMESFEADIDFTNSAEIADILKRSNNRSAPGPDGIRYKHLKLLHKKHPWMLTDIFNDCLELGHFPHLWRTGKAVFIPKPGKPANEADSYRPLSLLNCMGKTLEHIIRRRIKIELHDSQYGFRRGRSTEQCIRKVIDEIEAIQTKRYYGAAISLDIKGAFDHLLWPSIINALTEKGTPNYILAITKSYLSDRWLRNGNAERRMSCGSPQGGVLSPDFWNITYDTILQLTEAMGIVTYAFADDTMVLVQANTKKRFLRKIRCVMQAVRGRLSTLGLRLNLEKTEILLFTNFPRYLRGEKEWEITTIPFGDHNVEPVESMKYLGVIIDDRLQFREHIEYINKKAIKVIDRLYPIFRNTYGYGNTARRTMISACIDSLYFYASTIYAPVLRLKAVRTTIQAVERRANIRMARIYRTAGYMASTIIANRPPLVLRIEERNILYQHKNRLQLTWKMLNEPVSIPSKYRELQALTDSLVRKEWQSEWDQCSVSAWLRELVPNVPAKGCPIMKANFFLSQALTGHGAFGDYLTRIGRLKNSTCTCGNSDQTAKHVFKECSRYAAGRPTDWTWSEEVRWYLIQTMKALWKEEQERQRSNTKAQPSYKKKKKKKKKKKSKK